MQQNKPAQQRNKVPKRQSNEVSPPDMQEHPNKARKVLTDSSIMMREADIRAANKAAWSQLQ